MNRRNFVLAASLAPLSACVKTQAISSAVKSSGLAEAYRDKFLVGAAVSTDTLMNSDVADQQLLKSEFNSITAENCQKWEEIHPELDRWNWEASDRFVKFGIENKQHVLGHTLVWHSQIPEHVFRDSDQNLASPGLLKSRMENHINTLVDRYKGKIDTWDVVNEIVSDDGYDKWRESDWYKIMGPEFFYHAFKTAHAADPKAELLYNDYNMHYKSKQVFLKRALSEALDRGVPIHGVGLQAHYMLGEPSIEEIERAIEVYAEMGLSVHITELDVDVLPAAFEYMGAEISTSFEYSDELNPYPNGLPEAVAEELATRYAELFKLFIKHKDSISRVTTWGTTDANSWKNNWPVKGRTNYPLLFDRSGNPKKAYHSVLGLVS